MLFLSRYYVAIFIVSFSVLAMTETTTVAQTNSLFNRSGNSGTSNSALGSGGNNLQGNPLSSGGPGAAQLGQLSQSVGQNGFIGRNNNSGQFVGNRNAGQQNAGRTATNFQRSGQRTTNQNRNNRNNSARQSQNSIRPVQRIAFSFRPRTAAVINSALQSQLQRLSVRSPRFRGISFKLQEQGQVVLRGVAASESARKLATALVRLEPGVRSVKNEMTIRSPAPSQ